MKATDVQIGGSYYKDMAMQPIELITALKCSFIQGCIIKWSAGYKEMYSLCSVSYSVRR